MQKENCKKIKAYKIINVVAIVTALIVCVMFVFTVFKRTEEPVSASADEASTVSETNYPYIVTSYSNIIPFPFSDSFYTTMGNVAVRGTEFGNVFLNGTAASTFTKELVVDSDTSKYRYGTFYFHVSFGISVSPIVHVYTDSTTYTTYTSSTTGTDYITSFSLNGSTYSKIVFLLQFTKGVSYSNKTLNPTLNRSGTYPYETPQLILRRLYDQGQESIDTDSIYQNGYTAGESAGYESGFNDGQSAEYQDGYTAGESAGLETGYQNGYEQGSSDGYTQGQTDGYNAGYTAGESAGLETGYNNGYNDGQEKGYASGYIEGVQTAKYGPLAGSQMEVWFTYGTNYSNYKYGNLHDTPLVNNGVNMYSWIDENYDDIVGSIGSTPGAGRFAFYFYEGINASDFRIYTGYPNIGLSSSHLFYALIVPPSDITTSVNTDKHCVPLSFKASNIVEEDDGIFVNETLEYTGTIYGIYVYVGFNTSADRTMKEELQSLYFSLPDNDYNAGFESGLVAGSDVGYTDGYKEGYKIGSQVNAAEYYNKGYSDGLAKVEKFDFVYAISTVIGAPVQVVQDFLNFELLGVNMLSFVSGVITLLIIVKVIKFFI